MKSNATAAVHSSAELSSPIEQQPAQESRRLRLLFVLSNLDSGGAQSQLVTLARELVWRGHHVEFFIYRREDFFRSLLEEVGIKVHSFVKSTKFSLPMLRFLRKLMRTGNFDGVLSILPDTNLWTVIAAAGMWNGPKIAVSEGTCVKGIRNTWKQKALLGLIDRSYRLADWVTVNSYHMLDYYNHKFRWMRPKVSCIWNGVDLNRFAYSPLPAWKSPLKLLAVGRLSRYKNWECIIDALAILRDEWSIQVNVTHIGELKNLIPDEEQNRVELEQRIAEKQLGSQWHWLGAQSHIERFFAEHHGFVHASFVEGLPNVACEALACGRPLIIGNNLDHPLLVQNDKTGFVFDPNSPRSLAEALRRFASLSSEQAAEMGRAARSFAEEKLSTTQFANGYEQLFLQLANRSSQTQHSER
jgi:glycosyltransferase involved in cell wall biosynthesis